MKIYVNKVRAKRMHNFGRAFFFGGLLVLGGGFVYSLGREDVLFEVLVAAIVGTLLAQVGLPLLNKWSPDRRVDQALNAALKGLDDRWTVLHYLPGTGHALIGPPGVMALMPRDEEGRIEYDPAQESWIQDKPRSGLLRRGGRSEIGGLERKAETQTKRLAQHLDEPEGEASLRAVLVYMSDEADVNVDPPSAPLPSVHYKKLKDWLRRQPRGASPPEGAVEALIEEHGLEPV